MGEPIDAELDFKSQFYNLQGIHINERKKNFFKLLHSMKTDIPDDQIDIQPRSYQENIFYVDALIYFKKVERLTEILKRGSGVLPSKILKQQWFFQEAFKDMSEKDIVNSFLPTLPYSCRMKVLKKLSLTLVDERMDKMFDLVLERYGLFIAKQFLFGCSPDKITNVLKNNEITLLPEQLKRLLQKDVNLIKVYINEYKKNMNKDFGNHDFLNYLVWKHPKLYFELELDSKSSIKLGRHTTRAVIKANKKEVLRDIKNSRLNKTALVREVKEFDKEYVFLFFPADMKDINHHDYSSNLDSLLSKYPIKRRWEVFSQAFVRVYKKEISEHLEIFEEDLAKFFPTEIKQKWAEIKYIESDSANLHYIKYYDPKKAFKLLKHKINVTSERSKLLFELITICYENKDYSTYEEVLKYMCTRQRNTDKSVRLSLIRHIERCLDYNHLTEAHWKYINEILDIQRVRNEPLSSQIHSEYLVFVCKSGLPLDGPVTQFTKDCIKSRNNHFRLYFPKGLKEIKVQSIVLKHIVKVLPTVESGNSKTVIYRIMSDIVEFNKDIKNHKEFEKHWIDLNELSLIFDLIHDILRKKEFSDPADVGVVVNLMTYNCLYSAIPFKGIDESDLLNVIKSLINHEFTVYIGIVEIAKKTKRNNFENSLIDIFFNSTEIYMGKAIEHFLATEPEVIAKYLSQILRSDFKSEFNLLDYSAIKKYSHLGLVEEVIAHFKPLVLTSSKNDKKVKLLNALSKVMNTIDFLNLIKDYVPDVKKLDLDNEVQRQMYQVQCDIVKSFKNLDDVSILAPVLMHFCQGDYLQSSLLTLYKVMHELNEEKVFSYINVLEERAMSTKKHAVFLGFKLLSLKDAMAFYSVASNKETSISAKKYLFDSLLKYFIQNPIRSLLDIVVLNMDFVDKNDSEMITTLIESVNKLPKEFKPHFIEKVWDFLDALDRQEVKVTNYRSALLHVINNYKKSFILLLNEYFCEDLIKKHFLSSDDRLLTNSNEIDCFVVNFLLAYADETHFKSVFNIIKGYKEIQWKSTEKDNVKYILRFFVNAYEQFYANNVQFLELFTSFWQQLFNHVESFSEYTLLRLMALYKENTNIVAFCKESDTFFLQLTAENGWMVSDLVIKSIKCFYSNIPDNADMNLGNFALYLLQVNSSEFNCLIAFNIIQDFATRDQKEIYLKVVNALKYVDNVIAMIYYNVLLTPL